jgi:hypothetical protein
VEIDTAILFLDSFPAFVQVEVVFEIGVFAAFWVNALRDDNIVKRLETFCNFCAIEDNKIITRNITTQMVVLIIFNPPECKDVNSWSRQCSSAGGVHF